MDKGKNKNQENGLASCLRVKGFQRQPGNLSLIPGTHSTKREPLPKVVLWRPPQSTPWHIHTPSVTMSKQISKQAEINRQNLQDLESVEFCGALLTRVWDKAEWAAGPLRCFFSFRLFTRRCLLRSAHSGTFVVFLVPKPSLHGGQTHPPSGFNVYSTASPTACTGMGSGFPEPIPRPHETAHWWWWPVFGLYSCHILTSPAWPQIVLIPLLPFSSSQVSLGVLWLY